MTARVLVVDDVPANVKLLEARLSAEYFDVTTANSGAEALALCERAECDIVLLDVMMPDMDGFEVCRKLKSNPATHHIPVVMVTALDQPSDRVQGPGSRRRRFPHQAGHRRRAGVARALAGAAQDGDRRTAHARAHLEGNRHRKSPEREAVTETGRNGRILIVDDRESSYERIVATLVGRAHGRRRDRSGRGAVSRRRGQLRPGDRVARPARISTACGCAARSARSSAPATCRSWRSPKPTTMRGWCAGWKSASTTI